jgi:hypothetical protein
MKNKVACQVVMMATVLAALTACSKGAGSFSILADGDDYKQEAVFVPKKIDVLWVVDNSGSMSTSQANLASSFQSFINKFQAQGYDFHMGITTSDAWEKQFNNNSTKSKLRDGNGSTHSGVFVMDQNTPNLANIFNTNVKVGITGNGDERVFESFKQTLLDVTGVNATFRRPEAYLAVIIVSDEEDFSAASSSFTENYNTAYPVQSYVDFLTDFTDGGANFSVNTISVDSTACATSLNTDGFARKVSTRLPALADLTGGVKTSLCGDFGTSLELISNNIVQLSAVFKLTREPVVDTINITINGVKILVDPVNGYTYDPATLTITFHGTAVPAANASVKIDYYPASLEI